MDDRVKYVLIAFCVRFALAPFFAHLWDMNTIQSTVYATSNGINIYDLVYQRTLELRLVTGNPSVFYEGYAYLPHALLLYYPFYLLYLSLGLNPLPIAGVSDPSSLFSVSFLQPDAYLFLLIMKLPIIIIDSIIVFVLFSKNTKAAKLYALSPYVIFITGIWGMFDSLVALMLLLSILTLSKGQN